VRTAAWVAYSIGAIASEEDVLVLRDERTARAAAMTEGT
jgi:hypothetical protein